MGCYGIQRIDMLKDCLIVWPAQGSAAARWSTPTPSTSRWRRSTTTRSGPTSPTGKAELAPYYDQAKRMLGVVDQPADDPADEVMKQVADEMGVGDTFHPTPVGVFFGGPGHRATRRASPTRTSAASVPSATPARTAANA